MRLIDTDKAYKVLTDYYHHKTEIQHDTLKEAIERVPTVDAVEVVRCKDCKYHRRVDWGMGDCEYPNGFKWIAYDNDFCSRGERREDNEAG